MIVIVDYGRGNIASVLNMLKRVGVSATVGREAAALEQADKIILPGVGAFDPAMEHLEAQGLVAPLKQLVRDRQVPLLGICLGMQLLADGSEEGSRPGLGFIRGKARRFTTKPSTALRIPHMGWNELSVVRKTPLLDGLEQSRFYFVHSYHVCCERDEEVKAVSSHGYPFSAVVQRDKVYGTQFHPEKSHRFGLRLLENFARQC